MENKIILIEKEPYLVSNEEIQIGDNVIVTSKMYNRDNSGVTIIEISKNND